MRIVSLLPSATDIVCSLGLRDQLVGRTHECDWPPGIESVPAVTSDALDTHAMRSHEIHDAIGGAVHSGTSIYGLDADALRRLKPDLVLTQELCDVCAVSYSDVQRAARVMGADTKIVSLEPSSIDDILSHVELVGSLTGTEVRAREVVDTARARLAKLKEKTRGRPRPRVACIEWLDPIFAGGHWVPEQVEWAGGNDVIGPRNQPSYAIEWSAVLEAQADVVVLMPCGMSIERSSDELDAIASRPGFEQIPAVRENRVFVVDGSSFFNRPGPRVIRGTEILYAIFNDEPLDAREASRVFA